MSQIYSIVRFGISQEMNVWRAFLAVLILIMAILTRFRFEIF